MIESDIVLLYIYDPLFGGSSMQWDPVWRLYIPLGGLPCDVWQRKVLDIAIDEVSGHCLCTWHPRLYRLLWYPQE
jgi:hypothetical protein